MKQFFFLFRIFLFISFVFPIGRISAQMPKNEIRAVWLTTNYALDWPTKPFKTLEDINRQKKELLNILYCLKQANFNMVFFQTRLLGNVVYNSKIERMSPYIKDINVNYKELYDPLFFAVEECHKLGLECHAWLITYPLGPVKIKGKVNCSLAIKQNQSRIRIYKGAAYLDPGDPGTNKYLISIIKEIIEKYDVDGIHMDYIRYPEHPANFPDDITYKNYGKEKNKTEWRKDNINRFVSELYDTVKSKKPWVQVSSAVVGMYDYLAGNSRKHWTTHEVCQDPEQWLQEEKHDFIVPMMYYSGDLFFLFIRDWQARSCGRFIVSGLGVYRIDEKNSNWDIHTITEQIQYCRELHIGGNAFFRTSYLMSNKKGIMDEIKNNFYNYPALLPPLIWMEETLPNPPEHLQLTIFNDSILLKWEPVTCPKKGNMFYNIYRSKDKCINIDDVKNLISIRVADCMLSIPIDSFYAEKCYYAVSSYDRYHNESKISKPILFQNKF